MQRPSPRASIRGRQSGATTALRRSSLPLLALLGACGGSDDDDSFLVRTSEYTYGSDAILAATGSFAVVGADESASLGGGDLNGDGDVADRVAVALRFVDGQEFVIPAAADEAAVFGDTIYLAVNEAGNNQWNSNGTDERVLLRWRVGDQTPEFIQTLDPGSSLVLSNGSGLNPRLFFAADETPAGMDETNLYWLSSAAAATPTRVLAEAGTSGAVRVRLVGAEDGMLFGLLDESVNGDQNGDADADDTTVLGLVESEAVEPRFLRLGVATLPEADGGYAQALSLGGNRYTVAFLVGEAAQGNTNLNGAVPLPPLCTNGVDGDTTDAVLHFVEWELGGLAPSSTAPINTGLPAVPGAERLLITPDVVGVIVPEDGTGGAGGCDLNADGDVTDAVLRWVEVDDPGNPEAATALLRAVSTGVPGGASGAKVVAERLVIATELNLTVGPSSVMADYLLWVDPTADLTYEAGFFDPDDSDMSSELRVPIDWMSADSGLGRHPVGLLERGLADVGSIEPQTLAGFNLNQGCNGSPKDSDIDDTIAAWLFYDSSSDTMRLAGLGYSVPAGNAGMVIEQGFAFFRVSESDDNFDHSGDGQLNDQVLFRSPVNACLPTAMGPVDLQAGTPAVQSEAALGGAFLVDENASGLDINLDGVTNGFAARFFRFD